MIENSTSYLGELGLQHKFAEIIKPSLPEEEIYKAFKKRLLATRMRLLCSNCGEYNITKEVREMDKQPECPSCGSRMIACLHRSQIDAANIIKKYKKKKQLAKEEEKRFKEIRRNSDIVMVYGKRACVALAGHGIGTETAARILAKRHDSKRKFLKDVLQAEKDFARTRIYWK
jgi:ATP-dependent Lhr-like helicase